MTDLRPAAPGRTRLDPSPPRDAPPPVVRRSPRIPDGLRYCLVVYLATRLVVALGLVVYLQRHPRDTLAHLSGKWDGWWYVQLAAFGYSDSLRMPAERLTEWHHGYSGWAFFPGYPLAIRAVHEVTRAPFMPTAIVLALVFGLLAVWAVYALADAYAGRTVARSAALLLAAFPGAAIFSQPYGEGLFTAAAAASLLCLLRRRWVLAGLAGAVASATRPTGVALIAAAAAVAAVQLWRRRDVRALAAPALASTGIGGFLLFGWLRTGDLLVWRHAENLWAQRFDLCKKMIVTWFRVLGRPEVAMRTEAGRELVATSIVQILGALALAAVLPAIWALRRHLTVAMAVYTAVTVVTLLGYSAVGTRPRTLLALIPAFVWLAAWRPRAVRVAAIAMVPLLAVLTYLWMWRVTP